MDDGRCLTLDLGPLIQRRDAYWRLRQDRYFRQVSLDPLGGICWPEGEDLAPDGLERYMAERYSERHCGESELAEDIDFVNAGAKSKGERLEDCGGI